MIKVWSQDENHNQSMLCPSPQDMQYDLCQPFSLITSYIAVSPSRKEEVKETDAEKEAAVEAELKAARDRAVVPLEARLNQFKDMLLERGVKYFNAYSNQLCNVRHINLNGKPPRYNLQFVLLPVLFLHFSLVCVFCIAATHLSLLFE